MSPSNPVTAPISQKELVIQLRQFAQDPKHQSALIENEECLKTLAEVLLTAVDNETCVIALQTLQFLASNPKYRLILKEVPKLMSSVEQLKKGENEIKK
ncbi:hypothetical protein RFI_00272 [Reticulomyxa filosa]|uniref:Uncharacterized protein n=1 Tax=Reticulomyxa filosa TaxID=46433 RepID=X6PE54_RETFI|nr:hypothetical protein RFI_00272 [Reticulomyxa filosa]|eukprot:ETO36790.1 hypothetical protein RFI_00272 [Reticulomyxa filosa]